MRSCLSVYKIGLLILICWVSALGAVGSAQSFKFLEVKVLDPDGKPMPNVNVNISLDGMAFPMPTDDKGTVSLNVPGEGGSRVKLSVLHDGFLAQGASWDKGESVPDKFEIPMKKGVPIGGIVHDEDGKPLAGVKIEGIMTYDNSSQLPGKGQLLPDLSGELDTTDKEGRWRVNSAPEESANLQLRFTHPEYVSDQGYGFRGGTWEELRTLEKIVIMQKGMGVSGTVVDSAGQPVPNAKVGLGRDYVNNDMIVKTDNEGKYRINNVEAGENLLTVFANQFAPDMRTITISRDLEPVDFKLKPGHKVIFKVVDPDGKPIPGVGIAADTWRNCRALMSMASRGSTDAEGMWTWEHAPADEVQSDMFCRGYMSVRGQNFAPQEEPHVITMPRALKVSGTVVDAETGEPLKQFQVIEGLRFKGNDRDYWQRHNDHFGKDGKFSKEFGEPYEGYLVRIEAEGYRPAISRLIKSDEGEVTLDFKVEKGAGPTGIVKSPDGKPVAGAEVLMATAGNNQLYISSGRSQRQSDTVQVTTDANGKFSLPFPDADFKLICLSDAGWSEIDSKVDSNNLEITLQPWAKVTGKYMRGEKPVSNQQVSLNYQMAYEQNRPQSYWWYGAQTDAEGKFVFDRVRAGDYQAALRIDYANTGNGSMSSNSHAVPVKVEAGDTASVQLGGKGRNIKGQMTVPEAYQKTVSWKMGAVQLYEQTHVAPSMFHAIGQAIANATSPTTPQPAQPQFRRSYAAAFDEDGNFEIFDVEPGNYQLTVTLYELPTGQNYNWNNLATLNKQITIPEGSADEIDDLGKSELKMTNPIPTQAAGGVSVFQVTPTLPQPAK